MTYHFEHFFYDAPQPCCIISTDGILREVNRAFAKFAGTSSDALPGEQFCRFVHRDDVVATAVQLEQITSAASAVTIEHRFRTSGNAYVQTAWTVRYNAQDQLLYATANAELLTAELVALATCDSLTQLNNRHAFTEQLDYLLHMTIRNGRLLSVLMIDVDFFKQYNDQHGHPAGDEILILMGQLLTLHARNSDFIARYGGDEFAILLPETDSEGAIQAASRYQQALQNFHWPHTNVTASIGAATLPASNNHAVETIALQLLDEVDQALYAAKHVGKNCVRHFEQI